MILVTRGTACGGESGAEGVLTLKGVSRARVVEGLGETVGVWGPSAGGGGGYGSSLGARTPQNGRRRARRGSSSGNSSTWRAGRRHVGGERICWARLVDTSRSGHQAEAPVGSGHSRTDRQPPGLPLAPFPKPRACLTGQEAAGTWVLGSLRTDHGRGRQDTWTHTGHGKPRLCATAAPFQDKDRCRWEFGQHSNWDKPKTSGKAPTSTLASPPARSQPHEKPHPDTHACNLELSQTGCRLSSRPGTSARCWG